MAARLRDLIQQMDDARHQEGNKDVYHYSTTNPVEALKQNGATILLDMNSPNLAVGVGPKGGAIMAVMARSFPDSGPVDTIGVVLAPKDWRDSVAGS